MEGFGQKKKISANLLSSQHSGSARREVIRSILATGFVLDVAQKITLTSLHERRGEEGQKASPTMSLSRYTESKAKKEEALASCTIKEDCRQ